MSEHDDNTASGISRRKFVTTVATTGAGLTILPRHVLGRGFQAPSDTLNIATVGINGQGYTNTRNLMGENIVAICDVDYTLLDGALNRARTAANGPATNVAENNRKFVDQQIPKLQRYKDYREMLDKQKNIDGVVVATPDHM